MTVHFLEQLLLRKIDWAQYCRVVLESWQLICLL